MKHSDLLKNSRSGWLATTVVATALLAGCGGGGGGGSTTSSPSTDGGTTATVPASVGDTVATLLDYLTNLFAQTSETTEPLDTNDVSLAADDSAEPSAVP